jgi:hypothetical protein
MDRNASPQSATIVAQVIRSLSSTVYPELFRDQHPTPAAYRPPTDRLPTGIRGQFPQRPSTTTLLVKLNWYSPVVNEDHQ